MRTDSIAMYMQHFRVFVHLLIVDGAQVLNLTVECSDRPGLLAEIAQIIADYGHNIKVCIVSFSAAAFNPGLSDHYGKERHKWCLCGQKLCLHVMYW